MSAGLFTASCSLCKWRSVEITETIAQCAAVWHVYEEHPKAWRSIAGHRPPQDPHPFTVRQALAVMS